MTTGILMSITDEMVAELEAFANHPAYDESLQNLQVKVGQLLAERAELKRDSERWRSVRGMLADMVDLHQRRGTVLTIHLDTLRDCLAAMQSEAKNESV